MIHLLKSSRLLATELARYALPLDSLAHGASLPVGGELAREMLGHALS
jgi:hypothetical protein